MDPQQRLLLESCWEALEDAGIDPASLRGEPAGVFAGLIHQGYAAGVGATVEEVEGYRATGDTASIASGRVAYTLGLEGPAITLDTACSSSLVAMHLASHSLRQGECTLALAGGVTVLSTPTAFIEFSRQGGLAPDGRSKSFAEAADGVAWSEGVGMLVLERLSDAERHGHPILATIKGSAVNQDGASNGLTAPNGPSQERVIRQALANAQLSPKDIDVVEAHGTGTTLGDPIEAGALLATYGQERDEPLKLGSIKSNIGHTQAAAGVAGVIKMTQAMRQGVLPKTLHVDAPSSKVDWDSGEIELLTEPLEWEADGRPRRASVSSFGISGTNAHVILEEAPGGEVAALERTPLQGPIPLTLSAKAEPALAEAAERLAAHLGENPDLDPTDIAYSLATTRSAFEHRAVALGENREELLALLNALASGEPSANLISARAKQGKLAYLLTGQGSQRLGMGRELYEQDPHFAEAFDRACEQIDIELGESLKDIVFAKGKKAEWRLKDTTYAQPALFAIEVALHEALTKRGLKPDLLTGHSVGEIAAAHISGVLSLPDAAKLVVARGRLMGELSTGGAMLAIEATEQEAQESIAGKEAELSIAGINSPTSIVLSGAEEAIEEAEDHWQAEGRRTKRLAVSHAFHSPLMEPMLEEFAKVAESLQYNEPQIPVVSNLTGEILSPEQAIDPAYWVSHAREPVRFAQGIQTLNEQGASAYLELGPDPVLLAMARECLGGSEAEAAFIPTLREGRAEAGAIATTIAHAHAAGAKLDWGAFFEDTGTKRVPLPTYPFQGKRYWLPQSGGAGDASAIGLTTARHPLLGAAVELAGAVEGGLLLTGRISLSTHRWLADHAVGDAVLLPGTAFLELALKAAEQAEAETVEELTLEAPLVLPETGAVAIQVSVFGPGENGQREIAIHSRLDGEEDAQWTRHATGALSEAPAPTPEPLEAWPPEGAEPIEVEYLYDLLAEHGLAYGPAFQGLNAAWREGERIHAEVSLPEELAEGVARFGIHPALLDSALHAIGLTASEGTAELKLPWVWSGVSLHAQGAKELRACLTPESEGRVSIDLADTSGAPVATVGALAMRTLDPSQVKAPSQGTADLLAVEWTEASLPEQAEAPEQVETLRCEVDGKAPSPEAARRATEQVLEAIQGWLADESKADSRLTLITRGAMAISKEESPDPATAAIWGLVRSAQSEHPGRFVLIDTDGTDASEEAIAQALSLGAEEHQLALREGAALVPRLKRTKSGEEEAPLPPIDPERTVLITGATGGLGALTARHLAEHHGARHLLLISRSGTKAEGAKALQRELEEFGAKATIAACDASDRKALEKLIAQIPAEHPLGAVFHCAGVLADATIETLTSEQLQEVFAPKANAAHNLHELTADQDLSAFVLYSSAAGTMGGPGQANYAAANVYLDALAQRREAEGKAATAIAWGLWQREGGMAGTLGEADLARMRRSGVEALSDERGLELLDAAIAADRPQAIALPLDPAGLRALASVGALPPIFSGLVRGPKRRSAASGSLAQKLASLTEAEHEAYVLELVRGEVAAVLGHSSTKGVEPTRAFQELGFDSLAAVELRNRLDLSSGLRLAATVVFDYPNATALAEHLLTEATTSGAARQVAVRAQASDEPIAILGMACRYPGGVSSPEELWGLVAEGCDGITEFPTDRGWDIDRLYNPDPEHPGTSYTREGGFLHDAAEFDAEFFGIAPREALATDPQQRLLLESCWEALEDAGIDPASLRKSPTGVFAGVMYQDYGPAAGGTQSIVSGRISYTLGLEGPAITVDTACSSSLVAMHLASQALRGGECSLALAGGVTTLGTPGVYVEFSRQRGLAPDGRSKSFAEAADGVAWSEGVGVLVLERLSEAKRKGHPILALLKGSAVNQDGASNGLTAPNGPSQERVIRQALANARLEAKDIDAVEAHGTGTTLGDPIEAGALLATYGQDREQPLRLGSIKSNIGHTQAAAGVAGVIKMTQAMRQGVLPKTLHVDAPSSKVEWESGEIELLTEQIEWEAEGRPRRAGVSSFGISGTNAHVILEEAPEATPAGGGEADGGSGTSSKQALMGPVLLTLSAKAEPALAEAAERLATHITQNPELDPTDIAYSLATTRSAFEHRAVALGEDREELLASLSALANGEPSANLTIAKAKQGKLAYLLTGQGSQRLGMGKELYEQDKYFAEAFDRACEELDAHLDISLKEIVFAKGEKAEERLKDTTYAQPALFAIEVALHEALAKRGLKPDLLTGHSVGEIAAAQIAGVLSLSDAAKLVVARGKLMGALPSGGAMVAIEASEQEATESIAGKEKELSIAGINSPSSIVLSGAEEAIEEAEDHWQAEGRKTKRLAVSHAFHSPLMEPMLEEFAEVAQSLQYAEPQIPVVSNLTGEILTAEQATDPAYWVSHAREPVRFAQGIETLAAQGASAFLELGPDPVLLAMARECLADADTEPAFIPTLREGRAEAGAIQVSIAHAHAAGAKLDWGAFFKGTGARRVPLPTYPFQRKRYWLDSAIGAGGDASAIGQSAAEHPLLAAAIEDPSDGGLTLTGRLSLSTHRWLADHAVGEAILLPGTAFLELALRAAEQVEANSVEELTLEAPLVLPETGSVAIQVSVSGPGEDGRREIAIHSRQESGGEDDLSGAHEWTRHATGALSEHSPAVPEPLEAWPPEGAEPIEVGYLYDLLAEHGLQYGPAFQGLSAAWREGERIHAEVSLPEEQAEAAAAFGIHPALLDAALHGVALSAPEGTTVKLPFSWSGVSLHAQGARELRVTLAPDGESVALQLADSAGAPVASVASLALRSIDPTQVKAPSQATNDLLAIEWTETPLPEQAEPPEQVETLRCEVDGEAPSPEAALEATGQVLEAIQEWLADESKAGSRLALITKGAMAAGQEEPPDPAAAAIWGLVRTAQSEHPGRFALIDTDGTVASEEAIASALALGAEEPQLALREGTPLVPRLIRTKANEEAEEVLPSIDPERTVLITGATGGLGALTARHLAEHHGARHLLLISRSGAKAKGAKALKAELEELGAKATIAACDASDRKALAKVIAQIPDEHPLGAVFHCAGVLADATIETLTKEQIEQVFAPKADAAHNLHELTADEDLSAFVLYSSAAGTMGGPGQANYAAANVYLDALAQRREAEGKAATSIAWGLWQREGGMAGTLGEADLARMRRSGVEALSDERGLELLDAAIATDRPQAIALPLDTAGLRAMAAAGALPPILSGLIRAPKRGSAASGSLAQKLASLPQAEHEAYVLDLVRAEVAAVLGHSSAAEIEPERAFQELGFDSLAAVELRNRLNAATGLGLGATTVFDYPNAAALAGKLLGEATASGAGKQITVRAQASDEPIAILGMACRYPGGVSSPEELWGLVAEGRDGITEFPSDRGWDTERLYDPDPENPRTSYVREGGFLSAAGSFDAEFFGISPREALAMDPQQRLLLESCWEALEDAGIDPASLRGEPAGVFAGLIHQAYGSGGAATSEIAGYQATGSTASVASGRISYTLGLEGPAITIDTACSSSLVAMHLASQALRQGECNLALAGGVTALADPGVFVEFSRQRGLAPDGRSKSFAEAADGVAWSEGVGVLVLERLSEAKRKGHPVLALLKGSAVNQDGASNGLTAPNGPSQERVIRQALANARLEAKDIDAVEAHGTGTTLGDPIEAGALLATYGQERDEPLRLGSIKSNIGHTQAAAGVAGVIKMTQAMREGVLPKTLHVDAPSSKVEWDSGEIELLTEQIEWEANGKPRRAGISSFGISGTNAHVILEEAPAPEPSHVEQSEDGGEGGALQGPIPLTLSAKAEPALAEAAERLATHITQNPELDPTDIAYSLATTRSAFEHRAVVLGEDREELLASLNSLANDEDSPNLIRGLARTETQPVFLFPGQGAQAKGMATELLDTSPAFAKQMAACEEALAPHVDWSLTEVLREEEANWLDRLDIVQPALFAVMVSLAKLWRESGVTPQALIGHSQGEIAAAHISGALSLDDAALIIAHRGKAMAQIAGKGAMLSVSLPQEALPPYTEPYAERISLAAINGPTSLVLSGEPEALKEIEASLEKDGIETKQIAVDYAAHSSQIEDLQEELLDAFSPISPKDTEIPLISTVSGEQIEGKELGPSYWYRNLRQTVLFEPVLRSALKAGKRAFIEIGPHPVLAFGATETIEQALEDPEEVTLLHTLRRDEADARRFAASLAQAHAEGIELDWQAHFEGTKASRVPLPTYPFQRKRYWLASQAQVADASAIGLTAADHPLLGAAIEDPTGEGLTLSGRISLATHPWLADHAVAGVVLLPGTAFLELALHAAERVGAEAVEELALQAPLVLPEAGAVDIRVTVSEPDQGGRREIAIHSRADGEEEAQWTPHAQGTLSAEPAPAPEPLDAWPPGGAEPIEVEYLYDLLAEAGLEYGPTFQGLTAAYKEGERIYAEVSLPEEQAHEAQRFAIHPALLDSALHGISLSREGSGQIELPWVWSGVSLQAEGAHELRVCLTPTAQSVALQIADGTGVPVAEVSSLALRPLDPSQLQGTRTSGDGLLQLGWTELALPEQEEAPEQVETLRPKIDTEAPSPEAARRATEQTLEAIQAFLADESKAKLRLALITQGAMATRKEESPDPAAAAIWGLVRSAQSEHPGRFALIDTDDTDASEEALPAALAIGAEEPQIALREGVGLAPRAMPVRDTEDSLIPPPGPWRLGAREGGTLESLVLLHDPMAQAPLGPQEVRIAIRAAGLNFREVLAVLGYDVPAGKSLGGEGAGVVVEVGEEVVDLAPGDRVMGMFPEAFAQLARSDQAQLLPIPGGWSFEQAAALPIVFATAFYGLRDLAGLKAGERVLIHAGAGGVGMAAIGIAKHIGAEVFATASPSKWDSLREAGIAEDHIASSRDLEFAGKFLELTDGSGVDVVLNSLAGEFVDASLALLPRGGRFLEMGRTDMRDPDRVAADHPGVSYNAFDIVGVDPGRVVEMLSEVTSLIEAGALQHSPIQSWDMRQAPQAFRQLREGRNVGKLVLTVPRAIDPERTVLITGATGGLGALTARHLAERHGARHLLLISRSGAKAKGAKELQGELKELGAKATIAACDASDRKALAKLIAQIPTEHPLGAVFHCAGVLADSTIETLTKEQIEQVFAPKADAAHNLHELTVDQDLSAFVLYSSAAGTMGGPGQANYAAANVYLDALAQRRRAEGQAATAIAWGLWQRESAMTANLSEADLARMRSGGIEALSDERGLELLDAAISADRSAALAAPIDTTSLRAAASAGALPPILSGLVRAPRKRSAATGSLVQKLTSLPEAERESFVLDLVRSEVAAVLGHSSGKEVDSTRAFQEMGFDSLAAVELRNRLGALCGIRLATTVVFDYPNAAALASHLLVEASASGIATSTVLKAQASDEPIAIVGMACRYPGGVSSPEELWAMVREGRDGITEFPTDRGWDTDRLYDPDPENPRTSYVREGGFLSAAGSFDAEFFGISPREALAMDPQQRLLLESCWEALEDAGIDPASLRGEPAGVFAGLIHQAYGSGPGTATSEIAGYQATGSTASVASGRISYLLGLEGPAITIDTACSSSLVALHLAAGALRQGECTFALAGGVTALANPGPFVEFSRQRLLSPHGRSKSFAEAADGVAWSEGVGVLVLERLSEARRKGHPILALLKGSAVNQDGASNGLTAPNGPSQERVIRQALANARLEAKDIDAVEAHGTGTTLGDPIEAGALLATYGQEREQPLRLGSIKSNIGHTQAAAGVAGVIKMTQAMRQGVLPKTLHVDAPSSKVEWEAGEIELLTEPLEWEADGRPRRAGISSFGISGTNAHVILEEAPGGEVAAEERVPLQGPIPLTLSAKAEPALAQAAERLAAHITQNPELDPTDIAYSLATTRSAFEHRAVVLGEDREELLASLGALANGEPSANLISARAKQGKLAYLLTGQGSQRLGMGKELYEADPHFKAAFDQACEQIDAHLDVSLKDIVFAKGKKAQEHLKDTTYAQPALFAIEVALHEALAKRGLKPDLLTGHSVGEIAAVQIAGVLSLPDAAKLVVARGKLMGALPTGGAMVAIEASEQEATESIAGKEQELSIAGINSPSSTVLSGAEEAIEEAEDHWQSEGRRTKRLAVSHAFHSPLMEPMLEEFAEVAQCLQYAEPQIPIVSNLTGEILSCGAGNRPRLLGLPRQGAGPLRRGDRDARRPRRERLPRARPRPGAPGDDARVSCGGRERGCLHPDPARGTK